MRVVGPMLVKWAVISIEHDRGAVTDETGLIDDVGSCLMIWVTMMSFLPLHDRASIDRSIANIALEQSNYSVIVGY
jgi:hypothetical protein